MTLARILPSTREWPLFGVSRTREIEVRALSAMARAGSGIGPSSSTPAEPPSGRPGRLMEAAGAAVARLALAVAPHAGRVWIAAGPGNNGGDGLEAARQLAACGRLVEVDLHADPSALPADARLSFERANAASGVTIRLLPPGNRPTAGASFAQALGSLDIAIDALLGIGASRPPVGTIAEAIRQLNALDCAVLAVDLPSGLDANTGQPLADDAVVNAAHTLSLLTLKPGLFTGAGRDHAGTVWLCDLGTNTAAETADAWLSASRPPRWPARRHAQNKGSFGDVLVVGGASGMTGAGLLAGRAASAAGAGRVYLHLLQGGSGVLTQDVWRPELMFRGDDLLADAKHVAKSTVVCGCGGGEAVAGVLGRLIDGAGRLVLDADALNAVAADPSSFAGRLVERGRLGRPTVLTPHPLEAARLLGETTAGVQADRLAAAGRLVERFGCSVVLKGSGSIVATPGQIARINASGNARLASAGTGDVLAGWLGGLWAQSTSGDQKAGFGVACRAVAEHGAAADPEIGGSMRASDLIEALHRRRG